MDEITIGDKVYISSKRAAQITGYAKDYVGQLCREGRVEARLVGRSWYVLESSIREHRFGSEADSGKGTAAEEPEKAAGEVETALYVSEERSYVWSNAKYVPEVPDSVPELAPKSVSNAAPSQAIADMQAAWSEWFEQKRSEAPAQASAEQDDKDKTDSSNVSLEFSVISNDQVIDQAQEEEVPTVDTSEQADEKAVPIHRIPARRPEPQGGAMMDIAPTYAQHAAPARAALRERPHKERSAVPSGKQTFGAVRATFMVIAFLAVLVALVGTGHADALLSGTNIDYGVQKTIVDYLGGTSYYKSTL